MKIIIAFVIILMGTNIVKANSSDKEKLTYEVLDQIGILNFTEQIKKTKKYKSIEEIDELDYQSRWFYKMFKRWDNFNPEKFEKGLFKKLVKNFSKNELNEIKTAFQNPFFVKVLSALVLKRDIIKFYYESLNIDNSVPKLVASRYSLIQNLYLLHGMSIQKEMMEKKQQEYIGSGRTIVGVLDRRSGKKLFIKPIELKKRLKNSEQYFISYIGKEINTFRHYEIREYLRVMKKSVNLQRFLQLYTNYHFLYMMYYLETLGGASF